MGSAGQVRDWLSWLVKVRILVILFLLGIELVVRQFAPSPVPIKYFLTLILLWIALALFYAILRVVELDPYVEGHLQLAVDLLVVTALVYVTGSLESYFVFLYLLVIIVASILLTRVGAFLLAALAFLLFAGLVEAAYLLKAIPTLYPQVVGPGPLQVYLGIHLFAFLGVWYLSSHLAESLRKTGVELLDKGARLEDLQAFNENIIQSMRGGLLTTDLQGRVLLLNPAGEEILGVKVQEARGASVSERFLARGGVPAGGAGLLAVCRPGGSGLPLESDSDSLPPGGGAVALAGLPGHPPFRLPRRLVPLQSPGREPAQDRSGAAGQRGAAGRPAGLQ